jgi:DHA2 family multidrug resistance protein-like MFS transporter
VVSLALTGIFFYLEVKVIEMPLLPAGVFNRKIGLCLLCLGLGWGSFGIWQYYYWSLLLDLRHYTPIHAGLTYLTFCIMGIIAALLCGFIMSRTSPSYIISFASIAFMCGCIMLSITPVDQSFFRISFGQLFILVWGMDLSFPAASLILSDNLPIEQQGMAGLLVTTVTNFSVSLILGISSTAEIEVFRRTGNTLLSYRAALYLGIGVSGLGVLCSFVFIYQHLRESKQFKEEKMGEVEQEDPLRPTIDKNDLNEVKP